MTELGRAVQLRASEQLEEAFFYADKLDMQ